MTGILKFIPEAWITDAILAAIASLYAWAQVRIHLTRLSTANQAALDSLTKIVDAIANAQAKTGHLPTGADLPALEALALAQAKTEWPTIEKALVGDLEDIIHHKMAVATVVHPALLQQLDPRLATVNMSVKATPGGLGGFVGLRMVLALGLLALGIVLARPAMAQIVPDPVPDHWAAGILTPGLRFNLTGGAPASVGAGSGVDFNYLFGKYLYTTKSLNAQTGKPDTLPWLGISLFAQGAVNVLLSGTISESENASIGAGVILLDSVTLGWGVDLVSAGGGQTSGLFTNHLSLANTFPVVFYSVNLGAL